MKINKIKKRNITLFRPQVRTRHPSHAPLRTALALLPFRSIVRLGSTTPSDRPDRVECNSIQGVKNSADKLKMKQCFTQAGVKTANWFTAGNGGAQVVLNIASTKTFPIIAKHRFGSRGTGNYKLDDQQALEQWLVGKDLNNYIFEEFSKFSKEYRIHVTHDGCFYACRKLLKNTAPEGTWQLHDDGTVAWIVQTNPAFKEPSNWNDIVLDCVRAKDAIGLDICSFDVKVQGSNHDIPNWIIIESQSAPSFGDITLQKYIQEIPKVLTYKKNN
jgi:glutathione synthase/RimK-type ligase-like ATP-grasp enzyme